MGDAESSIKEVLLLPVDRVERVTWRDLRGGSFTEEFKRLLLSKLSLAGASLAASFCNVTGFSFIIGLSCALDTLSGQAYGAKLYRKFPSVSRLAQHGKASGVTWSRPFYCTRSWKIRYLAHPWTILLCLSAAPHSLFPKPELDQTTSHYLFFCVLYPCSPLLAFGL